MTMFNSLAPSDIESMTILKDASETAQYGSRGASGVIVVTTTFAVTSNNNPDLKWEVKKTFDAGIDLSMWGGRFNLNPKLKQNPGY